MDTLIIHANGALKYSAFLAFSFGTDGVLYLCTKDNPPQGIVPFDEELLLQFIRDGKLNAGDLGCLGGLTPISSKPQAPEQDSDFPTLLFLIRDCKGNIKLCRAESFIGDTSRINSLGTDDNASVSCDHVGIYSSAFLGNFTLCTAHTKKDIG